MASTRDRNAEARKVHKKLLKRKVLDSDFSSTYFGYFKSKDAFAHFKLYGTNNVCGIPGCDHRDYAKEIFAKDFAFLNGHVFMR